MSRSRLLLWVPVAVVLGVVSLWAAGPTVAAVPLLYLAVVTPELVRIDMAEHRLPNRIVLPGLAFAVVGVVGSLAVSTRLPVAPLIAGVVSFVVMLLLAAVGGMGMGDVKLAAVLGLSSFTASLAVLWPVIAFLVGGVVSAVLLARGRRGQRIAFGPYLLLGFWVAVALVPLVRSPGASA